MTLPSALDVFISSSFAEFGGLRKRLARRITRQPFLHCIPLEEAGAESENVLSASMRGVREADIYVGIFGKRYSRVTVEEYREAVRSRKLCLIYIKDTNGRDKELVDFIKNEITNEFKYHRFKGERGLYRQVESDLGKHLIRLLHEAIDASRVRKREAAAIESQAFLPSADYLAPKSRPVELLEAAGEAFKRSSLLESAILTRSSLEQGIKELLGRQTIYAEQKKLPSFGVMLGMAYDLKLISRSDLTSLRKISHIRNEAAHGGRVPNEQEMRWALDVVDSLLRRWKLKDEPLRF